MSYGAGEPVRTVQSAVMSSWHVSVGCREKEVRSLGGADRAQQKRKKKTPKEELTRSKKTAQERAKRQLGRSEKRAKDPKKG